MDESEMYMGEIPEEDVMDMLDCYGLLGDPMEREMREHGVSWSDFI